MGVTVASLHSCGIVQRSKEMLKRVTRAAQVNWLPLSAGGLVHLCLFVFVEVGCTFLGSDQNRRITMFAATAV